MNIRVKNGVTKIKLFKGEREKIEAVIDMMRTLANNSVGGAQQAVLSLAAVLANLSVDNDQKELPMSEGPSSSKTPGPPDPSTPPNW